MLRRLFTPLAISMARSKSFDWMIGPFPIDHAFGLMPCCDLLLRRLTTAAYALGLNEIGENAGRSRHHFCKPAEIAPRPSVPPP